MITEQQIRELTTRLIQILVLFDVLWAAVFVAGIALNWSGLSSQLTSVFFGAGFCSLILIVGLAILNVASNLNIISRMAERNASSPAELPRSTRYWPILAIAIGLVILVTGAIASAEIRLYRTKKAEAEAKLESIADTALVTDILQIIRDDGTARSLSRARDALAASIQSGDRVSLLIPRTTSGVKAYYEFTGWWWGANDGEKIGSASLPRYVPTPSEEDEFAEIVAGKIDHFSVKTANEVRSFRRIARPEGEVLILIDTRRQYGDRKDLSSAD